MDAKKTLPKFGLRDKIGYALGDFGCNMSFAFINNYLMLFYVTCMKLDPNVFAVIILVAKIFDAINDPIIGGICDSSKIGKSGSKFKPWIKWASLPLLAASILLFIYVPDASDALKAVMCLGLYCIWSVAYTSVNVPYGSMQSVITDVPSQRSELSTWRSIGAMLAQIPIMVVLPLLVFDENDNPKGNIFIYIVAVMGIIGFISFFLTRKLTVERVAPTAHQSQKFNYGQTLLAFFKNKHMLGVTISSVAYLALMMTVTNSMQYIFMCYFKNTNLITIASMVASCPIALGIVLAKPALKRFSKKQLCTYPFIVSAVASGIATFVRFSNPYIWIALVAVTMFGSAFYLTLMWALVADCIDYQEEQTGRREEGSIYATYSLFRKIAQGLGAALISFSVGLTGYDSSLEATAQAAGVPEKIYFMTGFIPFIGSLICLLSMHFLYNLNDKKDEIQEL
ncbi:MAG: glycoside-pentoside-hexuronide (GPH):cation symporter [Clostridia bacterium]|nr:glycoside-pentoside-hexuronide (GPH):cation symporter [Clostridia bacterium]